jgi:predicted  nucleic acid-binding Zn-ribbon protein
VKGFVAFVVVLALIVVALGFWRNWFEFGTKKEDGKVHANLDVNLNKFKADKEAFKKLLGDKAKSVKEDLTSLKNKAKDLTGEAKAKVEREIDSLTKRHEHIENKMTEIEESTEEKFKDLKNSLKDETEEGAGAGKANDPEASK